MRGLVDASRELLATARRTYDVSLGAEPGFARLRAMLDDARTTVHDLRAAVDRLSPDVAALDDDLARVRGRVGASQPIERIEHAIATLRATFDKLDPLLADAGALAEQIAAGEGSLFRLIRDPEFPEDAKDLGKVIKRHPWRILDHARNGTN